MITFAWVAFAGAVGDAGQPDHRRQVAPPLKVGMSTALTGPTAALGINMRAGVVAAFDETNVTGGIRGRQLKLIALDDGYEPKRTAPNMRRLVETERVLAVIGNVGTPTAVTAIPITNETKTPFFGAFTGASVLRKTPPDRYVINFRASYAEETAAMVSALIKSGIQPNEIAFFTQNDAYGDDGFFGGFAAVKQADPTVTPHTIAHARYERNTLAVESALADLLVHDPEPKAIIMVGSYAPCAKIVRLAKTNDFHPKFLSVSFVGAEPLQKALGAYSEGLIVTQVVPHFESERPIVREYRFAIAKSSPQMPLSSGSLEGYVVGRLLIHAINKIEGEIDRESIIESLESLGDFDFGLGVPLSLSKTDHQANSAVWPAILSGGKLLPMDWSGDEPR